MDENWGYPYDLGNLHLPRNITQLSFFCLTQRITTKDAWLVFREKTGRENPIFLAGSMLFWGMVGNVLNLCFLLMLYLYTQ